jgi:excisionase family DNA binding protein
MLTLKEVAATLRLSEEGARLLIKSGQIKAMKAGAGQTSPWRVSEQALRAYIRTQEEQAKADVS